MSTDAPGMIIGIDPTVDFAFKRLLGTPAHSRITLHFLNAVLGGSPRITKVKILNPILEKNFEDDKWSVLDVRATDEFERCLDVEMQSALPVGMGQRLAYYTSSMYVERLTEGQDYPTLRPAISICVLDAMMFPKLPDLHLDFRLRERQHRVSLTDDLQIHTIELPKYLPPANNREITDPIEKWAYFLRFASTSTAAEIAARLGDEEFTEAVGVLEMIAKTPKERAVYEARLKFERDERGRLLQARQEGRTEGRAEGRTVGRTEGELIGTIRVLQQVLGLSQSSSEELSKMDLESLQELALALQDQQRMGT